MKGLKNHQKKLETKKSQRRTR